MCCLQQSSWLEPSPTLIFLPFNVYSFKYANFTIKVPEVHSFVQQIKCLLCITLCCCAADRAVNTAVLPGALVVAGEEKNTYVYE